MSLEKCAEHEIVGRHASVQAICMNNYTEHLLRSNSNCLLK